jgi:hypothetical protein
MAHARRQSHAAWCTLGNDNAMLGDAANLGDDATPLGARSVRTTPSSETLGNNTKLSGNSTLGDNATLADDAMPLGNNTKLAARTLGWLPAVWLTAHYCQ